MAINTSQIIENLKKNLFVIVCGLVAIAGVVATFWPLGGMLDKLHALADTRAAVYGQLEGLLNQPRKLPLTDPTKTTQDDLTIFPNKNVIEVGTQAKDNVHSQSLAMVKFINDLNADSHTPLVDQVLPSTLTATQKYHFGDIYKLVLSVLPDDSIDNVNSKLHDLKIQNIRNDILKGGLPPTAADITAAQQNLLNNVFLPRIIYRNGQPTNDVAVRAAYAIEAAKMPDAMRNDIATKKKVYVAIDALAIDDAVIGQREPVPTDIWFAQLTLWIQQDVARAIAECNANSKNILDGPVKHLVKLNIPMTPSPYVLGAVAGATPDPAAAAPAPVEGGDIVPLPKKTNVSPTGRVCNPMYDVVQFTLVVIVDESNVNNFIQTLGHNRLIDVMNFNLASVDPAEARQSGFIYGSLPVVKLTLNCEALFLRKWCVLLMPPEVQKLLNIAPPPPAGTPAAP